MERREPRPLKRARGPRAAPLLRAGLAALLCALPAEARGQSYQVPVGPRAIGMGGAFSAVADDGSAVFWNPAGLPQIGHQELTATHANLFATGIRDNLISFVLPLSVHHAAAVEWYHSGFEDDELGAGENHIDFAYGLRFAPWLSAGATLEYLNGSLRLDGAEISKGQGWGADFGVLVGPWRGLRAALVAQDAFDTRIRDETRGSRVLYPRNVRAALAYPLARVGTVAFDLDDRWHLGVETYPLDEVALRAGVQDDTDGYERATWSYGIGLQAGIFRFDWAREHHPSLDATDHFALAMEFNFNPSRVRIERVEAGDIFTSQLKRYARDPFGTIQLRNLQEEPLQAQLSVFVPELMETPSVQQILLRPQAVQEVPLTAVFSDRALARGEDRPVQVEVTASYQSRRLMREDRSAARCIAYAPGAIRWGGGVAQAAAFVTTRDPAVDALARAASGMVARMDGNPFGHRNLAFAAAITDALASIGVAYVPDPNNPFTAISETEHAVDTVHYPYETLKSRAGDCDDTTVLMAALLENVGVPTRFVDVPGHLSLLVGTGVHPSRAVGLGVDERLLVVEDDQVWIPLETTELSQGFARAWEIGAEAYAGWQARGRVQTVDVGAAQGRFEPVVPPGRRDELRIDEADLRARIEADAAIVAGWRSEFERKRFGDAGAGAAPPSAAAEIEIARVYLMAGRPGEAARRLERALATAGESPALLNDLGVALAARGDLAAAERMLARARSLDAADPGVALNLGVVRYVHGDSAAAMEALAAGVALAGGVSGAAGILGLDPVERSDGPDAARLLLLEALQRAAGDVPTAQGSREQRIGGTPAAPGTRAGMRKSAVRAEAAGRIHEWMYWRK